MEAIYQIEKRHQNCAGYKKVTAILNNENGKNQEIPEYTVSFAFRINIKRVRRIMRKHGIKADVRQKKRSRKKEQQQYQEDNLSASGYQKPYQAYGFGSSSYFLRYEAIQGWH
nr:IS3 family transposase [Lactobacillus delbrueckii]